MKCFHIFTLFFCLVSLGAAIPIPGPGSDGGKPPKLEKGKDKAVDPPSPPPSPPPSRPSTPPPKLEKGKGRAVDPPSRPTTPTPEHDPTVPLPGRSGVHTDPHTGIVTMHYGDDRLPEHMGHLQRNQAEFPHNRNPLPLSNDDRNRYHALHNVPLASSHPVTRLPRVRDEKLPNMLQNPHHSTSTTVEYLPTAESHTEGGQLGNFKAAINKAGPNAQGRLRANPGWLPLHPDQRRGHEAPARLNSQTLADGSKFKKPVPPGTPAPRISSQTLADGSKFKKPVPPGTPATRISGKKTAAKAHAKNRSKRVSTAKASFEKNKLKGYTPSVGPSRMALRHRPGRPAPPPPPPPRKKKSAKAGSSNLRPGRVAPAGHVWKPSTGKSEASHFGAPGHLKGAEQRHPPRPQNHDHYKKQLEEGRKTEAQHKQVASTSHKAPSTKYLPKQTANLKKFEQAFGPARQGNGAGRAHEAPGRMQHTPANHEPPARPQTPPPRPPSPQGRQSRASTPPPPPSRPRTPPHGSSSKPAGSSRRK